MGSLGAGTAGRGGGRRARGRHVKLMPLASHARPPSRANTADACAGGRPALRRDHGYAPRAAAPLPSRALPPRPCAAPARAGTWEGSAREVRLARRTAGAPRPRPPRWHSQRPALDPHRASGPSAGACTLCERHFPPSQPSRLQTHRCGALGLARSPRSLRPPLVREWSLRRRLPSCGQPASARLSAAFRPCPRPSQPPAHRREGGLAGRWPVVKCELDAPF